MSDTTTAQLMIEFKMQLARASSAQDYFALVCDTVENFKAHGEELERELAEERRQVRVLCDKLAANEEQNTPPACPKCGQRDKMIRHDNGEWVCHNTHRIATP
jgi:predicted RNA-binding Zn-ribbon protein involved in translation (DUF1610 family)